MTITQNPLARLVMLSMACIAILISIVIYLGSFVGLTDILSIEIVFFAGIFLNIGCILWRERGFVSNRTLMMAMPKWVRIVIYALAILFVGHLLMLVLGAMGSPEIVDGQYVLDDHGTMVAITAAKYFYWKHVETRSFATLLIFMYFNFATYWWFVRRPLVSSGLGVGLAHE